MFCFVFLSVLGISQTFELYNGDTINRIDLEGKKQGQWRITGKLRPGTCYQVDQTVEEGKYINNRKSGIWTEHYCNGNLRNKLTLVEGRPNGEASMYHENGVIKETGTWRNNHWVEKYQQFDTTGKVVYERFFKLEGKVEGSQIIRISDDFFNIGKEVIKDSSELSCGKYFDVIFPLWGNHVLYNNASRLPKMVFLKTIDL